MEHLYNQIVKNIRNLMALTLEPRLDLEVFLELVARAAKELGPQELEARVYEVDFIENLLYLKSSTHVDVSALSEKERSFTIRPSTITGDAIIENRVIVASRVEGYSNSRFVEGHEFRAALSHRIPGRGNAGRPHQICAGGGQGRRRPHPGRRA